MYTAIIPWCVLGMHATGADYVEHQKSYCGAISCTDSHCTGGIHYGNDTEEACRSLCDAAKCLCFDWRDGTKSHPHPKQPNCRLANSSADYKQSGYGYTAFVSTTAPPTPPQPTAGPWINYACRDEFAKLPFCNTSQTFEARLDALVASMTTEEKASQLVARSSPPIDRLGIPFFCWGQNAINTLMPQQFTAFPIAPAMAATFNMTAVTALGAAVANNARVLFNRRTSNHSSGYTCPGSIVTWGPTINIIRDPRWGRNFEVPSEDPYLTGAYAVAWTRGAQQGEDDRYLQSIVTVKHWAAYSVDRYSGPDQPTPDERGRDRYTFNAIVDDYNFWDTFAPPFEAALSTLTPRSSAMPKDTPGVGGTGARGVMCSYNEVNGVPACFSPFLRDVLRGNFRFDGYVTSDTDAISSANNHHNYHNDSNSTGPTTPLEAVTYALRDGRCDMESSVHSDNWFSHYIPPLVASGELDEALVDRAVKDVFRVRFEAGLFDPWEGQPYARMQQTTDAAHDAEEAQRDAIVLLKNDNHTLPFHLPEHDDYVLALIGPYAHLLQPRASVVVQPSGGAVVVERGCDVSSSDKSGFERALSAAHNATHVLLCLGSDSSLEREYHDRTNTTLAGVQGELARVVLADNRDKTAVILRTRGALAIDQLTVDAKSIMLAWEYGGDGHLGPIPAAVEAVFGAFSPSGRLPYTMYDADYITRNNFFTMSMTSPPGRSYKYYSDSPLFPFGWGLSYARFGLSSAVNASSSLPLLVSVSVTNLSPIPADEVVMLFFSPKWKRDAPFPPLPRKQLIDFARLRVQAGEFQTHRFVVTAEQLRTVTSRGERVFVPGEYTLIVSNGAQNEDEHDIVIR